VCKSASTKKSRFWLEQFVRAISKLLWTVCGSSDAPFFEFLEKESRLDPTTKEIMTRRTNHLVNLPAMPRILATLNEALSVNAGKADVEKIAQTISYDKSLAAQCLRMANSALYGNRAEVMTLREAVLSLGLWRIRDLAFSCNLPLLFSSLDCVMPKEAFWRHALATAYVGEKLGIECYSTAREQIYLAGLLHDIGILINALLFPEDFREVLEEAVRKQSPVLPIEQRVLGFTHAESGRILADVWKLPVEVAEVIEFHHMPEKQPTNNEPTQIVELANQLCWKYGLGYGYSIAENADNIKDPIHALREKLSKIYGPPSSDYGPILEAHMMAARELADCVFGLQRAYS
jgi:HD-like signal output (HDOD) protein